MRLFDRIQQPCYDCFGVGTAVSGVAQAAGNVAAADKQAGAARDAANIAAQASTHAADVQSKSAADALAFERAQADYEAKQQEVERQANYGQWAAHEGNVSSIGELLGLGGKTIPKYVPGVPANFAAPPPSAPAAPGGAPPPPDVQRPQVMRAPVPPSAPQVPTVGQILGAGGISAPGAMAGSPGQVNLQTPQLMPDGTYRMPSSPVLSISDYLRT